MVVTASGDGAGPFGEGGRRRSSHPGDNPVCGREDGEWTAH